MKRAIVVAVALLVGCGDPPISVAPVAVSGVPQVFDHYLAVQSETQTTVEVVFARSFPGDYNLSYSAHAWTGTEQPRLTWNPVATIEKHPDRVRLTFASAPGPGASITWDIAVAQFPR